MKAVRRYEKLMMRRIDWTAPLDDDAEEEEDSRGGGEQVHVRVERDDDDADVSGQVSIRDGAERGGGAQISRRHDLAHFYDAAAAAIAVDGPVEDE